MKNHFLPASLLLLYTAFLTNLLVFKINLLNIGHLKFRFAGEAGPANLIPFKTILPYLMGNPSWFFATINLAGNILLFIPIGFLVPVVFRNITWKQSLLVGIIFSFIVEIMQVVFQVGIFDIDDVILNTLGVMIGYWTYRSFLPFSDIISQWHLLKKRSSERSPS